MKRWAEGLAHHTQATGNAQPLVTISHQAQGFRLPLPRPHLKSCSRVISNPLCLPERGCTFSGTSSPTGRWGRDPHWTIQNVFSKPIPLWMASGCKKISESKIVLSTRTQPGFQLWTPDQLQGGGQTHLNSLPIGP